MMLRRSFLASSLLTLAAACGGGMDSGNRGTPKPVMLRDYDLRSLRFQAAPGLVVSEEESLYPQADIVWRGDPLGPRLPQIGAMFEAAAARNESIINGSQPITVGITLVRFHGVTNRTRNSVGGVYNIIFDMTVFDANTGAVLEPARRVVGDLDAPGGSRARRQDEQGLTQKVRVTQFLTGLLRQQLV